jgi:signal transduction histidine kinase
MQVELAQIAAGLPMAASLAMATGINAFRESRRRGSLNEAIHELRRPLQTLALSVPPDSRGAEAMASALQLTAAAVDRLEHEVNGGAVEVGARWVAVRPIVEAAIERWRGRAAAEGRSLRLRWNAGEAELHGDPVELAQAVDNLISNGFEHGAGGISVEVQREGDFVRLEVRDGGSAKTPPKRFRLSHRDRDSRRLHGHGLRVVRRVAARHDGSFDLRRSAAGTGARLMLPLEGGRR